MSRTCLSNQVLAIPIYNARGRYQLLTVTLSAQVLIRFAKLFIHNPINTPLVLSNAIFMFKVIHSASKP